MLSSGRRTKLRGGSRGGLARRRRREKKREGRKSIKEEDSARLGGRGEHDLEVGDGGRKEGSNLERWRGLVMGSTISDMLAFFAASHQPNMNNLPQRPSTPKINTS
eukprot:768110-Hanusia_phi.AAC.2